LPILILTAGGGDELAEAFAAGANDFVRKPYSKAELDARVAALIRNRIIHAQLAATERGLRVEAEFRERFIGMLAHDLRQPLSTIVFANKSVARMTPVTPALTTILERELRAADRMTRMIGELLDFTRSRPETGMPIQRRTMDLADVCDAVVDEMRAGHPERTFRLNARGSSTGSWDRDRLAQVCTNLIGNAVEHSSTASAIDVDIVGDGAHVELAVTNQGLPISPALLPEIFEPFRQGRSSRGVGLGLHIVQAIVRAHHGTVAVTSDANATVFRVTLPRLVPSADDASEV
jgi:signal transduction histidine kinase